MILGSSELSNSTKQHPKYYFNTNRSKNKVFAIGRAYTQTLQDAAILGSMNPNIDNKKVVLLISMQWFMEKTESQVTIISLDFHQYNFIDF